MNSDQIKNLVMKVLVFLGGIAVAHGWLKAASWLNAEDTAGLVTAGVVWFMTHRQAAGNDGKNGNEVTADPAPAKQRDLGFAQPTGVGGNAAGAAGSQLGQRVKLCQWVCLAAGVLVLGVLAGCASFNATTYNTESLLTDAATGATHTFNQYAALQETNGPVRSIEDFRENLYSADERLSATLGVVDELRLELAMNMATNAAGTNDLATSLNLALGTAGDLSSNIVAAVRVFTATNGVR